MADTQSQKVERRGVRAWTVPVVAAVGVLVAAGCGQEGASTETKMRVDALAMEVEKLKAELNAARREAAAAQAEAAQLRDTLETKVAQVSSRTTELEKFNEALFGKVKEETGALAEQVGKANVRLEEVEVRFSKSLEGVEGAVAEVVKSVAGREREMADLRAEVKALLNQENAAPSLIRSVPPVYPSGLRRDGISGEAELVFVVDMAGNVVDPRVVRATHRDFGESAAKAVTQWRFNPALTNGRPVNAYVTQVISFKLKE